MASRVAPWAFAAVYGIVAIIAIWGGIAALSPPPPEPSPFDPNPLPPLVNSGMFTAAMFYFITALTFAVVTAMSVTMNGRNGRAERHAKLVADGAVGAGESGPQAEPLALQLGLNLAFAAVLGIIGAYNIWYGGILLSLGGDFYFLLIGLALAATAALLVMRSPLASTVFAVTVVYTIVWAFLEAGLDFLALLPRLDGWIILGLWFLAPWHRAAMKEGEKRPLYVGGRWPGFASLAAALLLAVAGFQGYTVTEGTKNTVATGPAVTDWQHYGGLPGGQRFAAIDQINVGNVAKLEKAWEFRTGVAFDFKQTPQMANGLVYICTAGNTLIAVDSDTGEERWRHDTQTNVPGGLANGSTFARTCRGVGYHEAPATYAGECAKRIVTGTVDARLIAVDALTGRRCESFGFGGEVNLVSGLGYAPLGNFMVTSTPLIAGDKIVVGGWVTDNQQTGNPSGVLRAYDAVTGAFAWAWDMGNPGYQGLPDEGGEYTRGTPNVWSNTAYDPELNLVYAPTGNSSPDYFDGDLRSKEAEENASAIVAIDAATGQRRWVYQTVHRDIWDYDVPSQPVLVDVRKNGEGELIPAIAGPTKRGEIFLLDRRTGVPIYETPELQVPQNPEVGEVVTATQPFSPLPHFREDRVEKDMWGLTPLDLLHCRIEFKKMRYEGLFTPPMRGGGGYGQAEDTWGGTFQYPGNAGGFNWGSVSVDADNGLLVGAPMLMGNRIVLRSLEDRAAMQKANADRRAAAAAARDDHAGPAAPPAGGPGGPGGRQQSPEAKAHAERFDQNRVLYRGDTAPFMSEWRLPLPFFNAPTDLPCFEPPFSQIGVIDLNTNKLMWKRPIGSLKDSGPFGIPLGLGTQVGTPVQAGNMTTRGGLIFHGGAMDATLRAFDLRTGDVKWESALPASAHATPMSYVGKNGKQYVLITVPTPGWRYPRPAPGEAGQPDPKGGYVIAYALPDGAQ
jgi:membrane-bound PQQ-dependent dehydrogenase (glucose/quinate/shikimate family)